MPQQGGFSAASVSTLYKTKWRRRQDGARPLFVIVVHFVCSEQVRILELFSSHYVCSVAHLKRGQVSLVMGDWSIWCEFGDISRQLRQQYHFQL